MEDRVVASPDGRYRVHYWEDEVRMGWWISAPTIIDTSSGETIFKVKWEANGTIAIESVHTYTRDEFTIWLDPQSDRAWIGTQADLKVPLHRATAMAAQYINPIERRAAENNQKAQERAKRQHDEWRQQEAADLHAAVETENRPPITLGVPANDSRIDARAKAEKSEAIRLLIALAIGIAAVPLVWLLN
jgi:hypothetical protein